MSDPLLGSPRSIMRRIMVTNVSNIWDLCRTEIDQLRQQLYPAISVQEREDIEQSCKALAQVVASLQSQEYILSEQPDVHKQLVFRLNDTFKSLLLAYIIPRGISYSSDNIEELTKKFYSSTERRIRRRRLCIYPGITKLIRLIRNHEEHDRANRPQDLVTGKRSFGNLYTLVGISILSMYAFIEILKCWIRAEIP